MGIVVGGWVAVAVVARPAVVTSLRGNCAFCPLASAPMHTGRLRDCRVGFGAADVRKFMCFAVHGRRCCGSAGVVHARARACGAAAAAAAAAAVLVAVLVVLVVVLVEGMGLGPCTAHATSSPTVRASRCILTDKHCRC